MLGPPASLASASLSQPAPFFREAGAGPGVVCLHANASHSSQWRALMDALAPGFHVLARAGDRLALVGHSYGAATALVAAVSQPQRVRALALYEPTLFSLVDAHAPPPNDADGIRAAVADAAAALEMANHSRAAECFIDFWMGPGAWARTPEARKGPIVASVANVRGWARALFGEPTPLAAFAGLDMPVLLMVGTASPASSRAVARLLAPVLPRVQVVEFEGLGHMGPITHPEIVNKTICGFLEQEG